MRIAVAQIVSGRDLDANAGLVETHTVAAAAAGADLIVFPEATMRAFGHHLTSIAEPLDGPWASRLQALAERHHIAVVAGMFTPGEGDRVRNTLLAVGPGWRTGYDKIHLYDAFGFAESATVTAGTTPTLIEIDGMSVGLATCYDVRFPALFTDLARRGAKIIVVPASWGAGPSKIDQWELLVRARALDSTSFVVACGQGDPAHAGVTAVAGAPTGIGHSLVVDPWGQVLRRLGPAPEMIMVDLDLGEVESARRSLPVLVNQRSWPA